MSSTNLNSSHDPGEIGLKAVKLEQDFVGRSLQPKVHSIFDVTSREESNVLIRRHGTEYNRRPTILNAPNNAAGFFDKDQSPTDSSFCSTSSVCPAPICRQFWKAGNYDDKLNSKPTCQNGTGYLHVHPKFLHSNATSHKWVFGAVAELLDNSVDEIQNGATSVVVDETSNPRDGTSALLIQDDGGGMDPEAIRRCVSFGFSDKKSQTTIGQYGNGFKTSSMRLGADVVVFSRTMRNRKLTQSVGLLSYTFLMHTRQDRIVVPMVDYQLDSQTGSWKTLNNEQHLKNNLSILLQWSPVSTEAELLKQCDEIGPHGTRIIVYNLWRNDDGQMELDFKSDPEDICISGKVNKTSSRMGATEQHIANCLKYSLRNFNIYLRGRVVEYHSIANDLKFPEFIVYRPQNVEGSVITTIGFLKEAPAVSIHGFNVYHKNRLILPFWHVVTYSDSRGRGVVGVLEANFIEPTHNKQEFEKTPIFQKLEARLKEMTQEYWDFHCQLIGYLPNKKPRQNMVYHVARDSRPNFGTYQPVVLAEDSAGAIGAKASLTAGASQKVNASLNHESSKSGTHFQFFNCDSQGAKRIGHDHVIEPKRVKSMGGVGSRPVDGSRGRDIELAVLEGKEAASIIQDNRELRVQCDEYEKTDEELNLKITRLRAEVQEAQRDYARLLLESKLSERVNREDREHRLV